MFSYSRKMDRFEKIRYNFYEYPVTQKKIMKTETYPIRYICPSSRVLKSTAPILSNNQSKDMPTGQQIKFNEDSTFGLRNMITTTPSAANNCESDNKALLSRSNKLATRKCRPRNTARYMTQPITLIEIKELEEDNNIYNTSLNIDNSKQ